MMRSYSRIITISFLAGSVALATIGCTNAPTTAVPQAPPNKTSAAIDAPRSTIPVIKGDDRPTETPVTAKAAPAASVTATIPVGRYWVGGTDQALTVEADRYRYETAEGEESWRSTTELKNIKDGVIFDGQTHWCLSTMAPKTAAIACSESGWVTGDQSTAAVNQPQAALPFVGTRQYTFPGGNGANAWITIEANGNTTIKDNSLSSQENGLRTVSVIYQGPFSTPIVFESYGLIVTATKVQRVLLNGEPDPSCTSNKTCEAALN